MTDNWRSTHGDDWDCPPLPMAWEDVSSLGEPCPMYRFGNFFILIGHADAARRENPARFAVIQTPMTRLGPAWPDGYESVIFTSDDFHEVESHIDALCAFR